MPEHHTLPTLDPMLRKIKEAKVFSKLDLRNGYWHVHLDEESSNLTVMATPFGRYKWRRLPFGLNVSSEIFLKSVSSVFHDLDKVHCIADNALICGYGSTSEEALVNHDKAMQAFFDRCQKIGIIIYADKIVYKTDQIPFMSHILTAHGILRDPEKVRAIVDMPPPRHVSALRSLCGCINYPGHFIPNLADVTKPLHDKTAKGAAFTWDTHHTKAVEQIRSVTSSAPVLAYFDTNAPITV